MSIFENVARDVVDDGSDETTVICGGWSGRCDAVGLHKQGSGCGDIPVRWECGGDVDVVMRQQCFGDG